MDKHLSVLMIGWELPPYNSGGLGVACYGLAKACAMNARIFFLLPKRIPVQAPFMTILFADLEESHVLSVGPYRSSGVLPENVEGIENSQLKTGGLMDIVLNYALKARRIVKNISFDIIHAHDWLSFPAGIAAKETSGKPLVVHVHATEFDRTGGNNINKWVYDIERAGMMAADKIVTVSDYTKRIIEEKYGIPSHKIQVVHNGIDLEDFKKIGHSNFDLMPFKEAGKKIVVFVGRLTLQKGPEYFIRAAKIVADNDPRAIFVIAGSGEMERQLVNEVCCLGMSEKVFFVGFLRGEELEAVFRDADLFVMSSVSEPFGLVALEAAMYDTPVIISKQSGVSEVLRNSLKADFWDVEELAHKMLSVLSYPALPKTLVENGKKDALASTWHKAADKLLSVFRSILKPT